MWCERIVRNLAESDGQADGREIDYVDIDWDECKSVLKKRSRGGQEVRVLLPHPQRVRHGDVLFEDESRTVMVNVIPCEVIVVRASDAQGMGILALELGNLHWPTQIGGDEVIFPPDDAAIDVVKKLGMTWRTEQRRFEPRMVEVASDVKVSQDIRVIRGGSTSDARGILSPAQFLQQGLAGGRGGFVDDAH